MDRSTSICVVMSSERNNCFNRSLYVFSLIKYLILKQIFQLFLSTGFMSGLAWDISSGNSRSYLEVHRLLRKQIEFSSILKLDVLLEFTDKGYFAFHKYFIY